MPEILSFEEVLELVSLKGGLRVPTCVKRAENGIMAISLTGIYSRINWSNNAIVVVQTDRPMWLLGEIRDDLYRKEWFAYADCK